jgi:formylglycine-generating enzyme required for sulfatase activity/serine/threonine protein kinase
MLFAPPGALIFLRQAFLAAARGAQAARPGRPSFCDNVARVPPFRSSRSMKECPACRRCFPDDVNHCPNDGDATTPSITGEPLLDGRYQLERRLGQGGMGVVYQARHIFLKTAHAIKIILPDLVGNDPMLITRFRQEAMAAAAIHHQNIIAVTDFGVVRGTMPFLVMEFVKGRSLHDLLAEERVLSPGRALEIMSPICAGMSAAHRQNIVHRDLKPLNIMMQENQTIGEGLKILDFGLAKIKSGELLGSFVQAKTSGLMGSPFYMAPEQWSDEEPDARADIYSLGVILYQMLGGDVPFKGASIPSIMKKHLTLEPPPLKTLGVDVPPVIEEVVRHALEKEAEKRPATASVFIDELRVAVSSVSGGSFIPEVGPRNTSDLQTMISMPHISMPAQSQEAGTVVRVHTDPPQSRVFINNISVGVSDYAGELMVPDIPGGVHRVRVVHEGYADWEQQIDCSGGECRVLAHLHSMMARSQAQISSDQAQDDESEQTVVRTTASGRLAQAEQERKGFATTPIIALKPQAGQGEAGQSASPGASTQTQLRAGSTQMMEQVQVADATPLVQPRPVSNASPGRSDEEKKSSLPKVLIASLLTLVLLGGGLGVYFLVLRKSQPSIGANTNTGEKPGNPGNGTNPQQPVIKPEMVAIPGGTFQMGRNTGTPPETPAHPVTVGSFSMDKTEVTNAEYALFVGETKHAPPDDWGGAKPPAGQEQLPVSNVTFEDAESFAAWRSKRDGVQYRLPTEEEWEYAARGGDQNNLYPWGNTWVDGKAVTREAGFIAAQPVGSAAGDKTRWGVLDMLGNVKEWTSSKIAFYPGNSYQLPAQNRGWIVVRGGSYLIDRKEVQISNTFRDWFAPTTKLPTLGFRLVRSGP